MIWIELLILLACILIGARLGGIGLGTVSGIGLLVFVFLFGLPPGGPPGPVLGMIIAVITALATMQAAGGLDYLVSLAERIMRRRPQYITFVAPIATYLLVFASGTTHVIYALLPVIAEVSRNGKIRPERPLSISVIAGFQGVIASPISAATVAMLGFVLAQGISLPRLLAITIPSTLLGVVIGSLSVAWRGKNLDDDPEYQKRLASGAVKAPQPAPQIENKDLLRARGSMLFFLLGIVLVVLIGLCLVHHSFQSGGDGGDHDARGGGAEITCCDAGCVLSGCVRHLFPANVWDVVGSRVVRSDRNDTDWKVLAQSQLHAARPRHHSLDGRHCVVVGPVRRLRSWKVVSAISAYLCDLCVKYFSRLQLTQRSQRHAEIAEKTK